MILTWAFELMCVPFKRVINKELFLTYAAEALVNPAASCVL
jgi:hypothetical protein